MKNKINDYLSYSKVEEEKYNINNNKNFKNIVFRPFHYYFHLSLSF